MPRPTKFNRERRRAIVRAIVAGDSREAAARAAGVAPRTLEGWLARGRAGEPGFAAWARVFDAAEQVARERYVAERWAREDARAKERYQRFKAVREQWWLDRLGPVAFSAMRVAWLMAHGKTRSLGAAVARLRAAVERARRAEGFCADGAP